MDEVVTTQPKNIGPGEEVNSYLPLSIVACILCNFCCLGTVALAKSVQSNNANKEGRVSGGQVAFCIMIWVFTDALSGHLSLASDIW